MNKHQRTKLIENQNRAFTVGSIEFINNEWVFYNDETEESSLLSQFLFQEIEVQRYKRWKKGVLYENGKLQLSDEVIFLKENDMIKVRKHLIFSLERLLEELNDDAFYQFITSLNSMKFSIYDCLYCYNHLAFTNDAKQKIGVNFMVFDNEESICNVQHHFCYYEKQNDRFEFTLNTGRRIVIEKISR
ncbi:DUF2777 domain-containing protein [Bacillus sp. 03113]|uniref:DUF2777 domain-containing protein n=1 Tax=Bacillus sp. 03113 TaxID=2578211 RepID=UPI0011434605|nr:DUF2777 domain-containing protein [Bacillus sp. 03113]